MDSQLMEHEGHKNNQTNSTKFYSKITETMNGREITFCMILLSSSDLQSFFLSQSLSDGSCLLVFLLIGFEEAADLHKVLKILRSVWAGIEVWIGPSVWWSFGRLFLPG